MVFTSDAACAAVADRTIREMSRDFTRPFEEMVKFLVPVADQIGTRRKVKRGELKGVIHRVEQGLRASKGVIHTEIHPLHLSRLSSNESYELIYFQTSKHRMEGTYVDLLYGRLLLTRNMVKLHMGSTDFIVRDHAFPRYMRRQGKDLASFFGDIRMPIELSQTIGLTALHAKRNNLALPIAGGLLLGKVHSWKPGKDEAAGIGTMEFMVTPDGVKDPHFKYRPSFYSGLRVGFEIKTFIDADSLTPVKEALYERLMRHHAEHGEYAKMAMEMVYFEHPHKDQIERIRLAVRDAKSIIAGPEWQAFLKVCERQERVVA